jgi:peroxiredoxin Q/BCP
LALHFSLLSDPEKTTMEKYGAYGEKMMYGKKVTGVIRSTFIIDAKGKIEQAFYNVRADGHAAKVLAALG